VKPEPPNLSSYEIFKDKSFIYNKKSPSKPDGL